MLRSSCSLDKYVWNFYVKGAVNSLKYCYAQYINQGKSCILLVSTVDVTFELLIKDLCPTSLAAFGLDIQWDSTPLSMLQWHCTVQQKHIHSSSSASVKLSVLYYLKVLVQLSVNPFSSYFVCYLFLVGTFHVTVQRHRMSNLEIRNCF